MKSHFSILNLILLKWTTLKSPLTQVVIFATSLRLFSLLYLLLVHPLIVPPSRWSFDSSSFGLGSTAPITLIRWDAFYYTSISLHGYRYEQELAFLPGWPAVMRIAGEVVCWLRGGGGEGKPTEGDIWDVVVGGTVVANLAAVAAAGMFYKLTLHLTSSPRFALLSSLFYALSPSPAVLSAPYTEPLFALLSFSGFLFIEESFALGSGSRSGNNQSPHSHGGRAVARKAVLGTLCLAATTMIRSLGTTSCLVVVWRGVVDPLINGWKGGARVRGSMQILWNHKRTLLITATQCLLILSPFFGFQYLAYREFCKSNGGDASRPWCEMKMPLVYGWVQEHYWNVGFLQYWEPAQIPNFLLAGPIIVISIYSTLSHFKGLLLGLLGRQRYQKQRYRQAATPTPTPTATNMHTSTNAATTMNTTMNPKIKAETETATETDPDTDTITTKPFKLNSPDTTPYILISTLTTFILLFSAHTQIALRVSSGGGMACAICWGLAELAGEGEGEGVGDGRGKNTKKVARGWIRWAIMWGAVNLVAWGGFYPPA